MLTEDRSIDRGALAGLLLEYGIEAASVEFLPLGADGHSYRVEDGRHRWFASVKRTLPHGDLGVVARGLELSYRAVLRLRDEEGIDFLSPALQRIEGGFTGVLANRPMIVQHWLDGDSHNPLMGGDTAPVLARVRRLHQAPSLVPPLELPWEDFDPAFEPVLEAALRRSLEARSEPGPYTAWLRRALSSMVQRIEATLARFRAERESVLARGREGWVVTHGEPGGHNVIWTPSGPVLVDCGHLRLAPPERDLVQLGIAGDELATRVYRRHYVLSEIAEYADRLSRPHPGDAEDERARDQLVHWLEETDKPWP